MDRGSRERKSRELFLVVGPNQKLESVSPASLIIGVDSIPGRLEMSRRFGANVTLNANNVDVVETIKELTNGRGVDVAIEALGKQETFENALRVTRPGGTLSSLGVYSGKLLAPYDALCAGLGDQRIVTTLCPGGKERMRRLMAMIWSRRVDLSPIVTHRFALDNISRPTISSVIRPTVY